MNPSPENGPTKTETLLGGANRQVTRPDGSDESVRIRQLHVRHFPAYAECLLDEPRMVELLCEKPLHWADTLTIDDFEAIIREGARLNADFFGRWAARRQATIESLTRARMLEGQQPGRSEQETGRSPTTSPNSPSPAGSA